MMKNKYESYLSVILLFLFIPFLAISQSNEKPKVGLVLSGGGAKGIAHLGLLHAMDSLDIKADYITGTSMGAIMGALYSIGYSANDIDSIIRIADWNYILSDDIPLSDIEVNEKHDYERYQITLNFSGNLKPKLPSGIVYGQHISEYFSKLTWRVADVKDFNDFEIPYKCVSADLITGKPWFFNSGDLATAMRSSMSIPTVFSPIQIDTLLLIDGGVYRNFPAIDVKEMGAEKIIGSYVGFKEKVTIKEMESLTNILIRTNILSGIQDIKVQEEICDIVVKYDLHGLSTKDFLKGDEIIDHGIESMNNSPALDTLVALKTLLNKYPKKESKIIPERNSLLITSIKTDGLSMVSDKYLISKSGLGVNTRISRDEMAIALNNMMGTLLFSKITYTLEKDKLSKDKDAFIVTFNVIEKARGQLQAAINYDNFFGASLSTNISVRNLLLSGSRTQLRINFSKNPIVQLGYDAYFGKNKKIQTSIKAYYEVLNVKSFFNFEEIGDLNIGKQTSTYTELSSKFAFNFNSNNQVGIDLAYQINTITFKDGADIATEISHIVEDGLSAKFFYLHDNIDRQFYPTKGSKVYFSVNGGLPYNKKINGLTIGDTPGLDSTISYSNYLQLELRYKHIIKLGNRVSITPQIWFGVSTSEVSEINKFALGGYNRQKRINNINMLGNDMYYYLAEDFIKLDFNIQYKMMNNLYLTLMTNATIYGRGNNYEEYEEGDNLAAGISAGYKSALGPIDAGFSINQYGKNFWHINIGFPF